MLNCICVTAKAIPAQANDSNTFYGVIDKTKKIKKKPTHGTVVII